MKIVAAALALIWACALPARADPADPPAPLQPAAPQHDGAGNRLEALAANGERWCTQDGVYCVVVGEGGAPAITRQAPDRAMPGRADALAGRVELPARDEQSAAAWPFIVDEAPAAHARRSVLLGVVWTARQSYAGGGASSSELALYEVRFEGGARATAVLVAPLGGAALIRACFSHNDATRRAGACADRYVFSGLVSLDESVEAGPPRLLLTTQAASYPGRRSRSEDSTTAPALRQSDLSWASDPVCSYRRVASRNDATGAYDFDQPLPPCADYLDP